MKLHQLAPYINAIARCARNKGDRERKKRSRGSGLVIPQGGRQKKAGKRKTGNKLQKKKTTIEKHNPQRKKPISKVARELGVLPAGGRGGAHDLKTIEIITGNSKLRK